MSKKIIRIRLDFEGAEADRFIGIREHLGVKNDTEVVRALVNRYWREHKNELRASLEHINTYEDHITIRDHRIGHYVDIFVRDGKLWCEHCQSSKCEHIRFAVAVPEIAKILEKRGWRG